MSRLSSLFSAFALSHFKVQAEGGEEKKNSILQLTLEGAFGWTEKERERERERERGVKT